MDADLMGSPGLNAHFNQGEFAEPGIDPPDDFVVRHCGACVICGAGSHPRTTHRVTADGSCDGPLLALYGTVHQRNVCLANLTVREEFAQGRVSCVVLGYYDQATRVFVEPVHNARAQIAARGRQRFEAMEQRVDQGPAAACVVRLTCASVDHHACGLVYNGEVRIFEYNIERDIFGRGFQGRGMRLARDGDLFTTAEFERCLNLAAVDEHVTLIEKELYARTGYAFKLCGNEVIEALACGFSGNSDGA
jgi:hypothetical protein